MHWKSLCVLVLSSVWLCACSDDTTVLDSQRTSIRSFLAKQSWKDQVDSVGGVYRYVINRSREGYAEAPVAERGNKLFINYSVFVFSSTDGEGAMIYTNNPEIQNAEEGLDPQYWAKEPLEVVLGHTHLVPGLTVGLDGVRQGDTLKLFMTYDKGYGDKPFGVIPANTALVWNLGIKEVIK